MATTHPAYRPDIDGLRAIAVLAVIAFHAWPQLVPGGFVGVDVFFVISGFLISGIIFKGLERDAFSFSDFYARRVRRIFPALGVVLVAALAYGWFRLFPDEYEALGRHAAAGAGFVSNIALWREAGYFDSAAAHKPLLHLWSLGIEEQFYICWPLALVLAWKRRATVPWLIAGVLLASFALNVWGIGRNAAATFFLPITRFWELLIGAGLAYVSVRNPVGRRRVLLGDAASVLGLVLILGTVVVVDETNAFPGWWALLPTIGTALLIAAGPNAWINRMVLARGPIVYVGLISYPLYLWHWPLLAFGRMASEGGSPTSVTPLMLVAASFALSIATYTLVEKPLRFGRPQRRGLVTAALVGATAVIAAAGLLTSLQHGWADRYPEHMRSLFAHKFDHHGNYRSERCFLERTEEQFAAECVDPRASSEHLPVVLIWGDSHAAMLYQGLKGSERSGTVALAQFTQSSCPPFLNVDRPKRPLCRHLNEVVFDRIRALKPATVLLAAAWLTLGPENPLVKLEDTVGLLRSAGVQRVVLVGPFPRWQFWLNSVLVRYMDARQTDSIPTRMMHDSGESLAALDADMARFAARLGIEYVSPYRVFCNADGCLTTVDGEAAGLTVWDHAHLTLAGARFLVDQTADQLFGGVVAPGASR